MDERKRKIVVAAIVLLIIAVALVLYLTGERPSGEPETLPKAWYEGEYASQPVPPPETLTELSGTVRGVAGSVVAFSPANVASGDRSRFVIVTETTKIYRVYPNRLDRNGNPLTETLTIDDLELDTTITVIGTGAQNLATEKRFDAAEIRQVVYE